nr:MAG TPA: hypothetical protein [Bacteriophage sp.]
MQIIQVIDLDGNTVKVDETNPSEPKIVSALQFGAERKNVAIGDVAELVFAKPTNANVEAICIGYKGKDGKTYGLDTPMFAPEPAPTGPKAFIELIIPSDYAGNPELRVRPAPDGGSELYNGADLNNGIYATLGDNNVYHFTHVAVDGEGVHTLRADKVYRAPLGASMPMQFGTSADVMQRSVSLGKTDVSDGLDYTGGTFQVTVQQGLHIANVLTIVDHL